MTTATDDKVARTGASLTIVSVVRVLRRRAVTTIVSIVVHALHVAISAAEHGMLAAETGIAHLLLAHQTLAVHQRAILQYRCGCHVHLRGRDRHHVAVRARFTTGAIHEVMCKHVQNLSTYMD